MQQLHTSMLKKWFKKLFQSEGTEPPSFANTGDEIKSHDIWVGWGSWKTIINFWW
jgi:hypothetical protein